MSGPLVWIVSMLTTFTPWIGLDQPSEGTYAVGKTVGAFSTDPLTGECDVSSLDVAGPGASEAFVPRDLRLRPGDDCSLVVDSMSLEPVGPATPGRVGCGVLPLVPNVAIVDGVA